MVDKVCRGEKDFPEKVYCFSPDVKCLYYKGNLSLAETRSIAVVGSRKCTSYGQTIAKELGKRAAYNKVTLISGLANGVNSAQKQTTGAKGTAGGRKFMQNAKE